MALKWKVAFIADIEDLGDGVMGFKLGPSDYELPSINTYQIAENGNNRFIMSFSVNKSQALIAYNWDEFKGVGENIAKCYFDVLARVLAGIGMTANQAKYLIGAEWYADGSWGNTGNMLDWENAGSPEPVHFYPPRELSGVE